MIRTTLPLDSAFNMAVQTMARIHAGPFQVGADSPATYWALVSHLDSGLPLVVWNGASAPEKTIYACEETNYAFRAWHDMAHYVGKHDFSFPGEVRAAELQIDQLRHRFGRVRHWEELVLCEVAGQGAFFHATRTFPEDQRAFALNWLESAGVELPNYKLKRSAMTPSERHALDLAIASLSGKLERAHRFGLAP